MFCSVFGCGNCSHGPKRSVGISFYSFPKDKQLKKKWIDFCGRQDTFRADTSLICSLHFNDETDYKPNNNKYMAMYGLAAKYKKLKKDALPSKQLPGRENTSRDKHEKYN